MRRQPRSTVELLGELEATAKDASEKPHVRTFAVALAYLVDQLCPDDVTTKQVFRARKAK